MDDEYQLDRANRLRLSLEDKIGDKQDVLSLYRKWLDGNGIPAERSDGWPTEHAYALDNIKSFVKDMQS